MARSGRRMASFGSPELTPLQPKGIIFSFIAIILGYVRSFVVYHCLIISNEFVKMFVCILCVSLHIRILN